MSVSGDSYCVDGFIVQHQTWNGSVLRKTIDSVSSYSFEWNQELQTVSVEAYNSLGSSSSNTNMTLEKQPKRKQAGIQQEAGAVSEEINLLSTQ